jgi:N-acetylglucosamine-6-phosphate deacetylase
MIVLSGADLVLPDRILSPGTLVIDGGRIVEIRPDGAGPLHHHYIVPGFIDVHIHGLEGVDVLDGAGAVGVMAARLPRYGVTAFCPTTLACEPGSLRAALDEVRDLRHAGSHGTARVLPAHLESNFISDAYRGAQPALCLRSPADAFRVTGAGPGGGSSSAAAGRDFTAADILHEIDRAAPDVGIVTLAPELGGSLDLIGWLLGRGHRVSLGHSGASFDEGQAAIAAGARHATHLFNRMAPFEHRAPGLVGAVLQSDDIAAELICDGFHVHPAVLRMAVAAKRPTRVIAITDGTAASGQAAPSGKAGAPPALGGQKLNVRGPAAFLDDGTLAGSTVTMDQVFRILVERVGLSLVDAVTLCATTAARELGLVGHGLIAVDTVADLAVLDERLSVVQTYVGGELVYSRL